MATIVQEACHGGRLERAQGDEGWWGNGKG